MKIFVTGASGQLGMDLVPLLEPHQVIAPNRAKLDVTQRSAVLEAMHDTRPDLVINCAAMTQVDNCETQVERAFAVNTSALRHLVEGCAAVGAHLTTISTDYVFDGTKKSPYIETDPLSPKTVYGKSKAAAERLVGSDATIVRTSWLNGAHGSNIVKTVLRLLGEGGPLRFVDDQIGQPTFAADLALVVCELTLERCSGVFHVTNQGVVSWFEFAGSVAAAAGVNPQRISPCSTADLSPPRRAKRPANSVLDNAALRVAGHQPTRDFRAPLKELVSRLR